MGEARPKRFGEISQVEKQIIKEIMYQRDIKEKRYCEIAEDLNAQSLWPRRAKWWRWNLVRRVYVCNKKSQGKQSVGKA